MTVLCVVENSNSSSSDSMIQAPTYTPFIIMTVLCVVEKIVIGLKKKN